MESLGIGFVVVMRSGCTQSGCHIRHEHCVGVVVRVWEFVTEGLGVVEDWPLDRSLLCCSYAGKCDCCCNNVANENG